MHLGATPLRLTTDMTVGYIDPYEGPTYEVSPNELKELDGKTQKEKESSLPGVHVSSVPDEWSEAFKAVLKKHAPLWGGNLGLICGVEHRIRLKPGAIPVRQHPYKAGPLARERKKAEVESMRSMGVIEPSTEEWASPVVMAPKPDGTVHFCIDYRRLNLMTVKDAYPIPRMEECLDSPGDAGVFSALDCNAGYWQIPVSEEDKHLTGFTCHSGAWKCVRLPFGLCNAPATFQRAMDMILAGVKWQICLAYLYDVIVFSRCPEEHLQHLDEVLTRLGYAGVTLKAAKSHFFQEEVEYLGHVIRLGRVHVLEKNLRALRGLRYPETQTQMKSFLGMRGIYRRMLVDFAKIAKPLTALMSTKLPRRLPSPREKKTTAFEELQGRLLAAPILALHRRDGQYIVDVDASYEQLGCCLQQQQPDGEYHPLGYYSRAFLPAEKNYLATEIEALGVVWAVTYLRSYLEGAEFLVLSDHRALLSVLTNISPNARINRWRRRLSEYTYEIRHKPASDHKVADVLSRLPTEGLDSTPLDEDIPVLAIETRASDALEAASPAEAPMGALTAQEITLGQAEDAFCREWMKELDDISPPDPKWSRQAFFCREKNGLLCQHSVYGRETQVVIPEALKQRISRYEHQSVLDVHPGSRRMHDTLRQSFYWPTIAVDVYEHVEQCPACAKNSLSERRHTSTMKLFSSLGPFSRLSMDLLGALTTSRGGQKHVLVICDRFTKLKRAIPLRNATTLTVSSAFIDPWVAAHGIPDSVLTDNGPQFVSV